MYVEIQLIYYGTVHVLLTNRDMGRYTYVIACHNKQIPVG